MAGRPKNNMIHRATEVLGCSRVYVYELCRLNGINPKELTEEQIQFLASDYCKVTLSDLERLRRYADNCMTASKRAEDEEMKKFWYDASMNFEHKINELTGVL